MLRHRHGATWAGTEGSLTQWTLADGWSMQALSFVDAGSRLGMRPLCRAMTGGQIACRNPAFPKTENQPSAPSS